MAIINSYPVATPRNKDLLIGTEVFDPLTGLPGEGSRTVTFTMASIIALISNATGAQTFQQVTNIGQTTIGTDSVSTTTNNIKIGGIFFDSASTKGTANQILTSNATGNLIWSDAAAAGVTSIVAGSNVTISPAGGTGAVTVNASGSLTTVLGTLPIITNGGAAGVRNVEINTMTEATAGAGGLKGAVPASAAGDQAKFLRADATWQPVSSGGGLVTSLTTSGSQGAATLNSGVLNIPNYEPISGSDTYVQYNDSNSFGSAAFFTTNKTSKVDIKYELGLIGDGASHGLLKIYCEAGTPHYVGIKGPNHTGGSPASYTIQLPNSLPSVANQILESNAAGTLSWIATPSGGGGLVTSLTTAGTSGASTITSGVLNIPQYSTATPNLDSVLSVGNAATSNIDFNGANCTFDNWVVGNAITNASIYGEGDAFIAYDQAYGLYIDSKEGSAAGGIRLNSEVIQFFDKTSPNVNTMLLTAQGAGVKLYYANVEKFETTSSGIRLNGFGSGSITGTAAYDLAVDSSGNLIETPSSTTILKTVVNTFTAIQIKSGGTLTFTMPSVPVGKQFLITDQLWYLDAGATVFNAPAGYAANLQFNDGAASSSVGALNGAQSFINNATDIMQQATSINYPTIIGAIVTGSGGTMQLILPSPGSSPTAGDGELYISIEYKEIASGAAFTL